MTGFAVGHGRGIRRESARAAGNAPPCALPCPPGLDRFAYWSASPGGRYKNRMQSTAELRENLKRLIVDRLNLIDVTPADIGDDLPLFKTGLGLDSIDALELTLNVEREYGVKVANSEQALQAFQSVAKLADFIETRRQAAG